MSQVSEKATPALPKFKRATLALEKHYLKKGTYFEVQSEGYTFEALTSDGIPVTLYVYKDPSDAHGRWLVNDYECNSRVDGTHHKTRKEAVLSAIKLFEGISHGRVKAQRDFVQTARKHARKIPSVKELLQLIEDKRGDLEANWMYVGVRFEDKERKEGEIITECSRHNPDREDERDFPDYEEIEYDTLPVLPGISTWAIESPQGYTPLGGWQNEEPAHFWYGRRHAYLLVSDDAAPIPDDTILDNGERLLRNAKVGVKLY